MKKITNLMSRLRGLSNAITRFPLTVLFFFIATVILSIGINREKDYDIQMLTCVVGAILCGCLQAIYEGFFDKSVHRIMLLCTGIIVTLIYYLFVRTSPDLGIETSIRTWVALLALVIGFLWIPTIRSKVNFNQSFMVAFKAFFHSIFYGSVIFGGCSLIIAAINLLIVSMESRSYLYTLNVVFVLFVPIFFFSLIPVYQGKEVERNLSTFYCPKFLEGLISYILVPLTMAYSVILILYILLNIMSKFWEDNLLEPLLIAYAISGIIIYILSSNLDNKVAVLFRWIFPKILVPIIVFQITSTFLSLGDTGITHSRYFVILFGIYAALAGIVMCFIPVRKNGILAAMLIIFSVISIIPPVDAFTVSGLSQENRLKSILINNEMLVNNKIIPNELISDEDKKKIFSAVEYLDRMEYTERIDWIPKEFTFYEDFKDTFGFNEYELSENTSKFVNVYLNSWEPIDIEGYDFFVRTSINYDENPEHEVNNIEKSGEIYTISNEKMQEQNVIVLRDHSEEDIIVFDTGEIFSRYLNYAIEKSEINMDQATFSVENDNAKMTIVVQNASMEASSNLTYQYADFFILVDIK